ncbi:hypothetical protein BD626DRAFT_400204 [Schizophyllum amplum]|uniref:CxC2-like cysteine cluster KDZ transposase-associated domain-containing protein n=1 Tax=Schizophyllum amplum TaxID=97359 RepID=A0A550CIX9_9AGAR|nr:hypothetical protein BD626DRAFT_400204 [Auriculariopsis ampla]
MDFSTRAAHAKRSKKAGDEIFSGSYTRKKSKPANDSHVSHGTIFSGSTRLTQHSEIVLPVTKRRRIQPDEDNDCTWEPTVAHPPTDAFEDYIPYFLMGEGVSCEDQVVELVDVRSGKRKRYASDDSMSCWRPHAQEFLHELLRHEALGYDHVNSECATCKVSAPDGVGLFKCEDCGVYLQCQSCCVERHAVAPTHRVMCWNGMYWDKSTTLTDLGLVYQIGHGGLPCPAPRAFVYPMTVIAPTHICRLKVRYCACSRGLLASNVQQLLREQWYPATVLEPSTCALFSTLDHFALLTVVANTNVRDFVTSLQCSGNGLRLVNPAECYRAFGVMSRQWTFLHRMKRAGRAHDARGIAGTLPGEAAVRCWACPQDGVNMPATWRNDETQYIHKLFLSMDANFRLKNRFRKNARVDAPLGGGSGCVVEPQVFKEHLRGYVNEEDISTCISFAALMEKDTKMTTGCRVSGCGACSCTRHETLRPNGLGDLQKGERYANMDFIFWSAIKGEQVANVMLTYDIGCQWKKNLMSRLAKIPTNIQPQMRDGKPILDIDVRLPVWHGNVHEIACRTANSMRYARGAGKPDGEGPERIWAAMNSMATATKEMGEGVRDGVIEGWSAHHNMGKNVGLRNNLDHRLTIAQAQRVQRRDELRDIECALDETTLETWREMYEGYEGNNALPNPFMPQVSDGPSEQSVRAQLVRDEAQDVRLGKTPMRATAKATFVVLGLQLEELQQRIASMARDISLTALNRDRKVQEQRIAWFKRLGRYRVLQEHFMPVAVAKALASEQLRDPDIPPADAEHVKVWLPSDLTQQERDEGCVEGLFEVEVRLRVAQCIDALKAIRDRLHARRFLINERNAHIVGQRDSTRARNIIARLDERLARLADKYRAARAALFRLVPYSEYPAFKELKDGDLTIDDDREADGASTQQLNGQGARASRVIGSARKTDAPPLTAHDRAIASVRAADSRRNLTSWIWTALGGPQQDDEAQVHDAVRVEWAKARARSERWDEEVNILKEEMCRVLRFLQWQETWWGVRAAFEADLDPAGRAGIQAYALRQAHLMRAVRTMFHVTWSTGSGKAVLAHHFAQPDKPSNEQPSV